MSVNKNLELDTISINWAMQTPGLTPRTWREIHFPKGPADPATSQLESELEWPQGTLEILEQAFMERLSRTTGWKLDHLAHPAAAIQAAEVFRRGVNYTGAKLQQVEGQYKVLFARVSDPRDDLKSQGPRIVDANLQVQWNLPVGPHDLVLQVDESLKSLKTVARIMHTLRKSQGVVTIIGGGILADTAAFAAALLKRPFRLVPTTLLAMVDACVGGKTGVNFEKYGKNQLGLFAFPCEVHVYPGWLKTLPEREIKAGLAEAYKHALISGDQSFAQTLSRIAPDPWHIEPHLQRLVKVKADIIQEDSNESGRRAILNFGHTLGHALENISQRRGASKTILHGEALAVGMRFAAFLSYSLGYLASKTHDLIQDQMRTASFMPDKSLFRETMGAELPTIEALIEEILQDKKNVGDSQSSEWVILKDFGVFAEKSGVFTAAVALDDVKKTWATFVDQEDFFQ